MLDILYVNVADNIKGSSSRMLDSFGNVPRKAVKIKQNRSIVFSSKFVCLKGSGSRMLDFGNVPRNVIKIKQKRSI